MTRTCRTLFILITISFLGFHGHAQFERQEDLSSLVVISDLDHTVIEYQNPKTMTAKIGSLLSFWKHSQNVQNVVSGVPEVLLQLQAQGARIIFVTGRDALDHESTKKELVQIGFHSPELHMRGYAGQSLREFKYLTIAEIIKSLPERNIILLGDTAHSDPEAFSYLQILAEIKNRILGVFVRPVSNRRMNPGQTAFRNGADLLNNLLRIGVPVSPSSAIMRAHAKYCSNLF